ncbi:MAG TPA: APC family permease [Steroidobacteraceae bacterium]|nr:APC family permease [Steroidobacteraceae bacterium]
MDEAVPAAGGAGRLRRQLSSLAVLLLTLSSLSPVVSVYGFGSDVLQHAGTGAVLLFLVGIATTVVWTMLYAELGAAYPYAGGDYVGVGTILGPAAGIATLAVWAALAAPAVAFNAQIVATYLGGVASFGSALPVTLAALLAALVVALCSVRSSAVITGLFLVVEMLTVLALIAAGLWHPVRGFAAALIHPQMLSGGRLVPASLGVMALSSVTAVYATAGGNQAIFFGEELRDPHRRMGGVIIWAGMIGALATALPVISVAMGVRHPAAIFGAAAPLSAFVTAVGGPAAGRALSAAVALATFNALIVQIMIMARLYFSLGRDGIFQGWVSTALARVYGPTGVPWAATLVIGALSGACCLLSAHFLAVLLSGLVVFTLALVSCAVWVGRRRGLTGAPGYWRSPLFPLAPVLGLALAASFLAANLADADAGRPGMAVLGAGIALALLWYWRVLRRRPGGWRPRLP